MRDHDDRYPSEEQLGETRKESRVERKRRAAKDRSKFKKTDWEKREKRHSQQLTKLSESHMQRGRVLAVSGQGIEVDFSGKKLLCTLKGSLKKEKKRLKNLVVVGDFVFLQLLSPTEGLIIEVEPRRSVLSRTDAISNQREHLLAANIDQVLITVSVVDPLLRPAIIDRYIIAAHKGQMKPIVLINKIDLLAEGHVDPVVKLPQRKLFEEALEAYAMAGIPLLPISVVTGEGIDQLKRLMQGKASVFSGQSGVGKSSLINAVTGLHLEVGDTVKRTRKGGHTTSAAQLIPLEFGGFCIDTPGIRSFGVWNLKRSEIDEFFTEIRHIGRDCQFPDCRHLHEQECAVKKAVQNGQISALRYSSFCALLAELDAEYLRR